MLSAIELMVVLRFAIDIVAFTKLTINSRCPNIKRAINIANDIVDVVGNMLFIDVSSIFNSKNFSTLKYCPI